MVYCPPQRSPRQPQAADNRLPKGQARQQKDTPSKQRRRALRALAQAVKTAEQINVDATARLEARAEGRVNVVASKTSDLEEGYKDFRDDKRAIYATGLVPEGGPFKGNTMHAGRGK